ncbi:MAG: response regulator transcription factor [Cyclobacteriaceae bacterium]
MKIVIIEDEPASARELAALVRSIRPEVSIDATLESIQESITYLQNHSPDLIFLDIMLADGQSFKIFEHVMPKCPIVFTTAYDNFAIKAFEYHSLSYLLKPITRDKVAQVFDKLESIKSMLAVDFKSLSIGKNYKDHFLVAIGSTLIRLAAVDIHYFFSEDGISFVCDKHLKKYIISYSLTHLEEAVDPAKFFRINRQLFVHRNAIVSLKPYIKGQVKVAIKGLEDFAVVSRKKTPLLKQWLNP